MPPSIGRFLRDNGFLVAAVSLPLVIVALFLLVSAVPRWMVPPPAYDVLLKTSAYDQTSPGITVEFVVENGKVTAVVRPVPPNTYPPRSSLWLFDHTTMSARQIHVPIPHELGPGEMTRIVPVEALAGRRVVSDTKAPDGYELQTRARGGSGPLGDLFGMGRYDQTVALVSKGRVIPVLITAPSYYPPPAFVGWLIDDPRQ